MEVLVLMADAVAFGLLLLWFARRRGDAGLFGWKPPAPPPRRSTAASSSLPPQLLRR